MLLKLSTFSVWETVLWHVLVSYAHSGIRGVLMHAAASLNTDSSKQNQPG